MGKFELIVEHTENLQSVLGLPGLKSIRIFLGLKSKWIADQTKTTAKWISEIENGRRDCTQKLQRLIARLLGCTLADLNGYPNDKRLRAIKHRFHLLQAGPDEGAA